jgi:hypothetical protein
MTFELMGAELIEMVVALPTQWKRGLNGRHENSIFIGGL